MFPYDFEQSTNYYSLSLIRVLSAPEAIQFDDSIEPAVEKAQHEPQ